MPDAPAGSLKFSCDCGQLSGYITERGVRTGTHVCCFCPDCRAAELYFGQPDPAPDPVDIFQLSPDAIVIEKGKENLALMRLGPNGVFRWYASCCNAPIANTLKTPKLPFAGIIAKRIADPEPLGPIVTKANIQDGNGKSHHEHVGRAVVGVLKRGLAARLSGRWRQNPFFDPETGAPVAQATIPTKDERAALYD
ncbi:hypothetical protein AVO45_01020 [Ruegeria marisrubri]|uniref:CENP-V/GFA domain-containing protein n=1 Tax=Ruegeria marisrubri TaxID=1685379 RepID=A0A117KGW7_9RHOB|nr:DUF6151 family protein [Ruegeria marisrubri]KUJ85605.1 hypothetical protein AVO45_01020 [Ruegeria marisrubri]